MLWIRILSRLRLRSRKNNHRLNPRELCIKGETLAAEFLKKRGYKILKRNHVSRSGEIDIVAYDKDTISFVEVKTRLTDDYGPPESAITRDKRRRIIRAALNYLVTNHIDGIDYRFDVVSVMFREDDSNPDIELLKGAFTADGLFF